MYDKGFVFGKFLPFHKGHEAMIRFARQHCNKLTVLVCCSDCEAIPGDVRLRWIRETFADDLAVDVVAYLYDERRLPNTSVTSGEASRKWAEVFRLLFPQHGLLVTSEDYGPIVAGYMGICHIPFDPHRLTVPVSATDIGDDLFANWQYLPDVVKPYYAKKVVVLGTESTGKSTLTAYLARLLGATAVAEAARDLIPNSNELSIADLYNVAAVHAQSIEIAIRGNSPLIIIDTDVHITQSYARFFFKAQLHLPAGIYEANKAGLYLYLMNDAPYIQDGTRLHEGHRNAMDASHKTVLAAAGIRCIHIGGSWDNRRKQAIEAINNWLKCSDEGMPVA